MTFLAIKTALLLGLRFAKCMGDLHAVPAYSSLRMVLKLHPYAWHLPQVVPTSKISMMFELLSFSNPPSTLEEQSMLRF